MCPDDCWSFIDREIDTLNERQYDPFHLKDEDRRLFLDVVKPYWQGRSINEKWEKQMPDVVRTLRNCGVLLH